MKRFCIDEETIIDYLKGKLQNRLRKQVEKHLCDCSDCRELLLLTADLDYESVDRPLIAASPEATRRAIKAVAAMSNDENTWRRHLQDGRQKLIDNARSLMEKVVPFPPSVQPAVLRSGPTAPVDDFVQYPITFAGTRGVIDIEKISETAFTAQVNLTSGKPLDSPIRVGLFVDEYEFASATLVDEAVHFENIPNGRYTIKFSQANLQLDVCHFEI